MNYTWVITNLKAIPLLDGNFNVISLVTYDVSAEENGTRITHTGFTNLPTDNIETFIPYDSLKPEMILAWVKHYLGENGVKAMEDGVCNELRLQSKPPQTAIPVDLPW
jgi:hypothetical protein